MNERIRKLADKLWEEKYWTNPNTDKLLPAQLNRFAELIVRECCLVIRNDGSAFNNMRYTRVEIANMIEEHFGVKE